MTETFSLINYKDVCFFSVHYIENNDGIMMDVIIAQY